jgi:T4 RnlA family RNA ligase
MRYPIPRIEFLSDVLPYIGENFYVQPKEGGYTVVNYLNNSQETFPDVWQCGVESLRNGECLVSTRFDYGASIRRECRGILFDTATGRVVARRLHKFFNLNERRETAEDNLSHKHSMRVYEKLDGSMITPIYLESGIRWGTKAGITDVGMQAEFFVAKNPKYQRFAEFARDIDLTPIFEWCSRKQKIVVDHPVDRLVLLDVRDMITGEYVKRQKLLELSKKFDIELVKELNYDAFNIKDHIAENTSDEGVVLQYDDGHRVKVKTDWYVALHRAKEAITRERDVIMLILDQKLDDLKPLLNSDDLEKINRYENEFWFKTNLITDAIKKLHSIALTMQRKEFALNVTCNPIHKAMVFKLLDKTGKFEYFDEVLNSIKKYPVQGSAFTQKLHTFLEWGFDWKEDTTNEDA